MTIKFAILGYLSWTPLSGYDLKKLFADSATMHWSGNSNQIYRALVELHKEGLVTRDVQPQDNLPARKEYTITESGRAALRQWILTTPQPPQLRNTFLVQLAWADQLSANELDRLLAQYEDEMHVQMLMLREQVQRGQNTPERTPREIYLWQMINQNRNSYYETQLAWARTMRQELSQMMSPQEVRS